MVTTVQQGLGGKTGLRQRRDSTHRINHGPVQWVGEQLRFRSGNLLNQALDVFAFLFGVGSLYAGEPGPINPEALVVVVVQRHQFPLAGLLVSLLIIKLVEDAVHRQLLPFACVGLTGAAGGTLREWVSFIVAGTYAALITSML